MGKLREFLTREKVVLADMKVMACIGTFKGCLDKPKN